MRKMYKAIGLLLFVSMMILSCKKTTDDTAAYDDVTTNETNEDTTPNNIYYPTVSLEKIELSGVAYPGVNVLTWKALKDAESYSIYRTVGKGKNEKLISTKDNSETYYLDDKIEANTNYKYRIVANPADRSHHDASEEEISIKTGISAEYSPNNSGSWAPRGTSFLELATYEEDYNASEEILSSSTIIAKMVSNDGLKVSVKFPVKPYAKYIVEMKENNNSLSNNEASETINGVEYNDTAIVYLNASKEGNKTITVTAIPINPLYKSVVVTADSTIAIKSKDISVSEKGIFAKWTNYEVNSTNAYARVYFKPTSKGGVEFDTDKYTIYRSIFRNNNDTIMENLGHPSKGLSLQVDGETEYYYDDCINLGESGDIEKIIYYVVLDYNDEKITEEIQTPLTIPTTSDSNWNYEPSENNNIVSFTDIYIDYELKINVVINIANWSVKSLTYGEFNTYNKALVSIESELPNTINLESNSESYKGRVASNVNVEKYYAFRLVVTRGDVTDIKTIIVQPQKQGDAYYLNVKSQNVNNIQLVNAPNLSYSKQYDSSYYTSVTLNFSSSNAKYFNIYRAISENTVTPESFTFIGRTASNTYTEENTSISSLSNYLFYKVEAVGSYTVSSSSIIMLSGLTAPYISLNGNELSWSSVKNAENYYIYRCESEEELSNFTESSNSIDSTSLTSASIDRSYICDYYYAIRAKNNSEYSKLSNICKVEKATVPSISINNSSRTSLSWTGLSDYTGQYLILRCDVTGTSKTPEEAKEDFIQNPNAYRLTSVSATSYSMNLGTSSTYRYYYAIAATFLDPIKNINCYAFSNVVEISNEI